MKTNNLKMLIYITTIVISLNSIIFAYPSDPDNAALLYYQSFLLCGQSDEGMDDTLSEVIKGNIDPNEKVLKYVGKHKQAIRLAIEGSKLPYCDWGLKYSDALSMEMPYLGHARLLNRIMLSDALICAKKGDYKNALERCLAALRIARHHGESTDIGFIMGISMGYGSNVCIQHILSETPANLEMLEWLTEEINYIDSIPFSFPSSLQKNFTVFRIYTSKEKAKELLQIDLTGNETWDTLAKNRVANGGSEFFEQNAAYWDNYSARVMSAIDLPYPQTYSILQNLAKESDHEFMKENPQATITCVLCPSFDKIYCMDIKGKTTSNATRNAIEIYKIKAETGKLPDELPTDLPKDLFSDKPFGYEKTPEGFILRCQGKDLSKNETYEYKFKVK